jgi:hypothetical protein
VSLGLGIDFLFPIAYATFLAILIHKLNFALWFKKSFFKVGNLLIWCLFLAAAFDYVENIALINLVLGDMKQFWVSISFYFALSKFCVIFASFVYILINFCLFLIKKQLK